MLTISISAFVVFSDAFYGNETHWIVLHNGSLTCQGKLLSLSHNLAYHAVTFLAICYDHASSGIPSSSDTASAAFRAMWQMRLTVPFYLVVLVFPLLNFKSPTFFTKFNGLGKELAISCL